MGGGPTSGDSLSGEALVERWGSWCLFFLGLLSKNKLLNMSLVASLLGRSEVRPAASRGPGWPSTRPLRSRRWPTRRCLRAAASSPCRGTAAGRRGASTRTAPRSRGCRACHASRAQPPGRAPSSLLLANATGRRTPPGGHSSEEKRRHRAAAHRRSERERERKHPEPAIDRINSPKRKTEGEEATQRREKGHWTPYLPNQFSQEKTRGQARRTKKREDATQHRSKGHWTRY